MSSRVPVVTNFPVSQNGPRTLLITSQIRSRLYESDMMMNSSSMRLVGVDSDRKKNIRHGRLVKHRGALQRVNAIARLGSYHRMKLTLCIFRGSSTRLSRPFSDGHTVSSLSLPSLHPPIHELPYHQNRRRPFDCQASTQPNIIDTFVPFQRWSCQLSAFLTWVRIVRSSDPDTIYLLSSTAQCNISYLCARQKVPWT